MLKTYTNLDLCLQGCLSKRNCNLPLYKAMNNFWPYSAKQAVVLLFYFRIQMVTLETKLVFVPIFWGELIYCVALTLNI